MPNYWIASTFIENYKIAKRKLCWACRDIFKSSFSKLRPGDRLTFYILGKKISGDFEVVSDVSTGDGPFGPFYPLKVSIKEIKKTKVGVFSRNLIEKLDFVKNKTIWSAYFRRPVYQISGQDYQKIQEVLD